MNLERFNEWLIAFNGNRWTNGDGSLVLIGHSKFFNLEGTLCDFYLEKNKKKWSDYLLNDIELLEFKKKYDKYIDEKSINKTVLFKEVYDWFDIDSNFLNNIDNTKSFIDNYYVVKNKIKG